ncbi:hypothetical protein E2C01_087698 [Portunus trituberculatus]|uniref:Uncharacterized protein n=1 Tax=Portunus trituberculatus TaxID=210409 RepID=A0A5B7J477_PORTR|nr:hypothetical protein [Portunus trituberculatus]
MPVTRHRFNSHYMKFVKWLDPHDYCPAFLTCVGEGESMGGEDEGGVLGGIGHVDISDLCES